MLLATGIEDSREVDMIGTSIRTEVSRTERIEQVGDAMKVLFAMSLLMSAFLVGVLAAGWLFTGTVDPAITGFFVAPTVVLAGAGVCGLFANILSRKE